MFNLPVWCCWRAWFVERFSHHYRSIKYQITCLKLVNGTKEANGVSLFHVLTKVCDMGLVQHCNTSKSWHRFTVWQHVHSLNTWFNQCNFCTVCRWLLIIYSLTHTLVVLTTVVNEHNTKNKWKFRTMIIKFVCKTVHVVELLD